MGAIQKVVQDDDNSLDALLADLNLLPDDDEVVVEKEVDVEPESLIESAEISAATFDEILNGGGDDVLEGEEPEEYEEPLAAVAEVKPTKKAKAPKEPKVAKVKAEPRKHYANRVERIVDKLGASLGDYTVLELADAMLEGTALKAKQQATLDIIKTSGKKVQNRQTFILEFIAGKSATLNGVIKSAVTILNNDGFITTGIEGNLHKALLAKPYSVNAAKAMGGNTLLALKTLKMVTQEGAGKYVANADSLILAKLNSMGVGA